MDRVDAVVIGAGVVGLAVARRLAMGGREVIVLERETMIGTGTSSRNSEVIHAGIYYPQGSLKARSCIEGKWYLYDYCAQRNIPHACCGKLIVATNEAQNETLARIKANAAALGMPDLEMWSAQQACELEPELHCTGALWSPTTGIIDSHALMLAFQGDAEDHGAMIAFESPLERAVLRENGIELEVGGSEPMHLLSEIVVNSAGLTAPDLARTFEGADREKWPNAYFCKGNYYTLPGRSPFKRLIYPVPEEAGLGVHVTVDLGGQCRFGPDTEWIDDIDYDVDPARAEVFYDAVRRYWPDLRDGALEPGYSGIRPKITPKGVKPADFVVDGPERHGIAGLVNLFGIESPGLTASWPLALEVARSLGLPELEEDAGAAGG